MVEEKVHPPFLSITVDQQLGLVQYFFVFSFQIIKNQGNSGMIKNNNDYTFDNNGKKRNRIMNKMIVVGAAEASVTSLQSNSRSGSKFPRQPDTSSDWLWKGEIKTTVNF